MSGDREPLEESTMGVPFTMQLWSETLLSVMTLPYISGVLIALGLGGLIYTIKSGHLGTVSLIGLVAITLFFGVQYEADLATLLEMCLFIFGIGLLVAEVFVIPGFGITGVSGIVLVLASLFLAMVGNLDGITMESVRIPLYTLAASFAGSLVFVAMLVRYLPSSPAFSRMVLQTESARGAALLTGSDDLTHLLNHCGSALTMLRPSGVATIDGTRYDVISGGEYIAAGEAIVVRRIVGRRIVVGRPGASGAGELPEASGGEAPPGA